MDAYLILLLAGLLCIIVKVLHVIIPLLSFKVTFTPHTAGSYEAVLQVWAQLVVGGEGDGRKASSVSSRVILKALAEEPKLEVRSIFSQSSLVTATFSQWIMSVLHHCTTGICWWLWVSCAGLWGAGRRDVYISPPATHQPWLG